MKQITSLTLFLLLICMLPSCREQQTTPVSNEDLLVATLYHQKAAEMEALCLQAYNVATYRLDELIKENPDPSKLAIVLDLDETVLDNSPYEAKCILENISYPAGWDEWMKMADASVLPGAADFLNFANKRGVEIFYVTNRKEKYRQFTMSNLLIKELPFKSNDNLLMRTDQSSKEGRRQLISKKYNIALLIGDNLADFDPVFDKASPVNRSHYVDSLRNEFGKKFIILPNAMYGDWLQAIFNGDNSLTPVEKEKMLHEALKGF